MQLRCKTFITQLVIHTIITLHTEASFMVEGTNMNLCQPQEIRRQRGPDGMKQQMQPTDSNK